MIAPALLLLLQEKLEDPVQRADELRIVASPVELMFPDGVLGALEAELTRVHQSLRPVLVRVRIPYAVAGADGEILRKEVLVSGVVIDQGGLFVAPGLVDRDSGDVRVIRFDDREFAAVSVAQDPEYGLTLFRAADLGVAPPPFGCCDLLSVGSVVIGLGNAFALDATLAVGFVSGFNRDLGQAKHLLQLSISMNPGDGGGLVANRRGQVVGIQLASLREAARRQFEKSGEHDAQGMTRSEALAFAMPIDRVLRNFAPYLQRPPAARRYLGVKVAEGIRPELCRQLGWAGDWVLVVDQVVEGSPAARAGLQSGDVLLGLAGAELRTSACLRQALALSSADTQVTVLRGDVKTVLPVRLAEQ